MPPMLPTRPWPQTLLLTALALLIAAATIMLACGPVAQPIPEEGDTRPAAESPATPTPAPTVCLQGTDRDGTKFEHCITPMPPKTPKYPNISGSLRGQVEEFEETRDAASGASGQSGRAVGDTLVAVEIFLSANTDDVAAWLESKGVSPFYVQKRDASPFYAEAGSIGGAIPMSLLGELSQQKGVVEVREPYMLTPTIVSE